jgi:arylsulfatase A
MMISVFRSGFAVCLCLAISATAAPVAKPNLIFILADDYGFGEVGCNGADHYKTPNLDALAANGIRYTHGYTVPLCGPSRAQILTGRYGFRTGATNQDATGRFTPQTETMMPKVLKTAGYATSMIGKWGQLPLGPAEFGFDDFFEFSGSGTYWNTQKQGKTYRVNGETRPLQDEEYLPDLMHQHLADFMAKQVDRPFYIYYSLSHVHGDILRTPDSAPDSKDLYGDNVRYMDKLVGKLMDELDRLKLREKTLVIFMGDNGTASPYVDRAIIGGRKLDGGKGSMREGGGLMPLIASWPGVTPAGTVSKAFVDSSDFFPTFAELAGAKLPENTVLDGHSLAPQLRGEKWEPRPWIFNQLAGNWYVREEGWKLDQSGTLYDMTDAPFSEKLVAADSTNPSAIAARKRLQAALDQLNPAGGVPDTGDESGRYAGNLKKAAKKKKPSKSE